MIAVQEPIQLTDCHVEFLARLGDYIEGRAGDPGFVSHTECRIGRWLAAERAEREGLRRTANLARLERAHIKFHEACEEALEMARNGQYTSAKLKLSEAYRLCGKMTRLLSKFNFTFG